MIQYDNGDYWLLIPQPAHAWFSGILAEHWGNAQVSRPEPFQSVVLGVTLHDVGWLALDSQPILSKQSEPLHFLEPDLEQIDTMYLQTASDVSQIDPYAGILVNRHMQMIFNSRLIHGRETEAELRPLINELESNELALIDRLQTHPIYSAYLDEATLKHNYRILRTCDLLSLFCCGAFPARVLEDTPFRYGASFQQLKCELVEPWTLHIEPNLFNRTEISTTIDAKVIPKKRYESGWDYNDDLMKASYQTITLKVIAD